MFSIVPAIAAPCFAMSDALRLTIQVGASAVLVIAVLVFMWKLPKTDRFHGWAPPLALCSAWAGLIGLVLAVLLWFQTVGQDAWVVSVLLFVAPASLCMGVLVLWIYRSDEDHLEETVNMQMTQARVGIFLGLLTVALGYAFVMTNKEPFTPVGM